jgi:lipopolysaccharide/colanic/teichoic acid biosynthesis glycosyltransferase
MLAKSLSRLSRAIWDRSWRGVPKRAFDVAISLVALALLAPWLGLIAIAIKRDSPGPVIFRGARMGREGHLFKMLKFRTMYESPESYSGPKVTAHDDPRVTPFGRWLRATKLNELPQFWNVLKGDMSLVGPRPEDPTIALEWPQAVRDEILAVRPGITSPASILYRNEEASLCTKDVFQQYVQEVGPDKVRLDQLYVRNCSFCLDLDTLLWTMLILVPKIRSYQPPERLLFVGPFTRLVRRYVNWFVADLLVALVAVGCTGLFWRAFAPLNVGWLKDVAAALALALLFSVAGAVLGVNRIAWSKAAPEDVYELLVAWAIVAILALVSDLLAGVWPPGLVVIASILALSGFVAVRYQSRLATGFVSYIMRHRAKARSNHERVLIVGAGQNAQHIAWLLDQPGNAQKFQVAGFVDDDLSAQGMRVSGVDVVGTWSDIPELVAKQNVKVIIVADHGVTSERYRALAEVCRAAKTTLLVMPNLVDSLSILWKGSSSTYQSGGEAKGSADFNCIQCLARRGAASGAPLVQESDGAEVL